MDSLAWKRLIGKVFRGIKARKVILIYHAVGNSPWAISENNFRQQVCWLKANTQIVSLTELLAKSLKKNTVEVALTFDDGYACLHDIVLPILKTENATATVYINTGWIGENVETREVSRSDLGHYPDENFLIWDEVKTLDQHGWEIGSHGVDHFDLTQYNDSIVKSELAVSKQIIEEKLQKKCSHFAYTFGKHTLTLRNFVEHAGYDYAVTGQHGPYKNTDHPLVIPRLHVGQNFTLEDFKNTVSGKWDFVGNIQRIKKWV